MKVGVYTKNFKPFPMEEIAKAEERHGNQVIIRNHNVFTPVQVEKFARVYVWGMTARTKTVIDAYQKNGIPVFVLEGPMLTPSAPDTPCISIGLGKHYWLPSISCPQDRLAKFKINIYPRIKGGDYILVCGQNNQAWCAKTVSDIRFVTDREIVFRPHPRNIFKLKCKTTDPQKSTFYEDAKNAFLVACETSNVGNLALDYGKPVYCSQEAMFAKLANTDLTGLEKPFFPSHELRVQYFADLSYTQWERQEIATGAVLDFYLNIMAGRVISSYPPIKPDTPGVTVITPTGDRPEALALLRKWMAKQTRKPDQWLIVDDGNTPLADIPEAQVIRRQPKPDDPKHTIGKNLEAAVSHIAHEYVLVMEDDDWYGPEYIDTMTTLLRNHELVGISGTKYYHPAVPGYREMGKPTHASLSQTAFRRSFIPRLLEACPGDCSVDLRIWKYNSGHLTPGADLQLHCGIKGMPGRPGAGVGHDKRYYKKDPELKKFRQWCPDYESYLPFT